jgi:two-component system LytT family response regulator
MSAIRTVIADDERLARQKLRLLLAQAPDIEIAADCSDGAQTLTAVHSHRPDLLFLDVRMPGLDGFQVLERIAPAEMPVVVFTTAYDQYAIKAFEASALDYLLKPFDQKRLHRTLERVREHVRQAQDPAAAGQLLLDLLRVSRPSESDGRLLIKSAGRLVFVDPEDIDWIEAAANYVKLYAGAASYLLRESIGRMTERLHPDRFVRIHRSTIINISKLRELQPCDGGEYIAVLKNGKALSCSRGYKGQIQRLIDARL